MKTLIQKKKIYKGKEKKLERIYAVIANKELSFGCKISITERDMSEGRVLADSMICGEDTSCDCPVAYIKNTDSYETIYPIDDENLRDDRGFLQGFGIEKVIGHPVMIGDCLQWIDDNIKNILYKCDNIYKKREISLDLVWYYWKDKRKPIDEQPESCIDYIHSLLNLTDK